VALGDTLGLQVVAEGIEIEEQMNRLRDLGCGYGQGFYFARPMELSKLLDYLAGASVGALAQP
jgi:EAL domain-containing protein (putative c-di-GMP-specific phosphodiesterase class I)